MTTPNSLPERVSQAFAKYLPLKLKSGTFIPLKPSPSAGPSEVARINGMEVVETTQDIRNALVDSLGDAGVAVTQMGEQGADIWSLTMNLEDSDSFGQVVVTYKKESRELLVSVLSGPSRGTPEA